MMDDRVNIIRFGEFSGALEKVSCPICEFPPEPRLIFHVSNGPGIWQCPGCEIMYASPRFTQESLQSIYENESFVREDHWSLFRDFSYEKWKEDDYRLYNIQKLKVQLVKGFLSPKDRILDVGCGPGLFCLEASLHGLNVEGIDPSGMLVEIGRKTLKLPLHHGLVEDFRPDGKYKGISVWNVLEHVYDLVGIVKKCRDLLESGGYLFVQVPNYEGISDRYKTLLHRIRMKNNDFKHFGFPWHLYSFNKKSLSSLMGTSDFETVAFEFWPRFLKDGADGLGPRIIISLFKKLEFSDYIILVARKK